MNLEAAIYLTRLLGGGPGSGCHGPNCGHKASEHIANALDEIHSRFPENPANPKERVLLVNNRPEATFHLEPREGRLRLKTIRVNTPQSGIGSLVLHRLTNIADRHNVTMELTSSPYGDDKNRIGGDKLRSWYEGHGFHLESGYDPALGYMVREPKSA